MLKPRIIPSLLIRDKGLVKTRQFGDDKYVGDPINAVKIFNEKAVDELAIFDIDAAATGAAPDMDHLRSIAVESRMPLCYGGGVSTAEQAAEIIAIGFEKVSVSAAALRNPDLIRAMAERVGRQSVVVTIDVRRTRSLLGGVSYTTYSHNGQRKHKIDPFDFAAEAERLGAGEIVVNDIDRDGMMQGYDLDLARKMRAAIQTPMTMLGGAGAVSHMADLIDAVGVVGAAAGSLFVFNGPYRAVLISYARPESRS